MTKVNVADSFSPLAERLGDNPKISPIGGCYGDYARRSIEKAFPGLGKATGHKFLWIDEAEKQAISQTKTKICKQQVQ